MLGDGKAVLGGLYGVSAGAEAQDAKDTCVGRQNFAGDSGCQVGDHDSHVGDYGPATVDDCSLNAAAELRVEARDQNKKRGNHPEKVTHGLPPPASRIWGKHITTDAFLSTNLASLFRLCLRKIQASFRAQEMYNVRTSMKNPISRRHALQNMTAAGTSAFLAGTKALAQQKSIEIAGKPVEVTLTSVTPQEPFASRSNRSRTVSSSLFRTMAHWSMRISAGPPRRCAR